MCVEWLEEFRDVLHVHHTLRMTGDGSTITPLNHAFAMKAVAAAVPVAWPSDGNNREKGSGILHSFFTQAEPVYRG
jgi:hypothetical protein